jgi:hypothetical protein
VPRRHVLVGDSRSDVEHDDTALAVDVVSISETTELLLAGGIPDIELDGSQVLYICRLDEVLPLFDNFKGGKPTVVKVRGRTSTPRVAMYFFSNSPVRWRLTKVVYFLSLATRSRCVREEYIGMSR